MTSHTRSPTPVDDVTGAPQKPGGVLVRTLSAAVLAPVALAAVWLGGAAFVLLVALAGVLMAWEWNRLAGGEDGDTFGLFGVVAAVLACVYGVYLGPVWIGFAAMGAVALAFGAAAMVRGRPDWRLVLFGVPYVALPVMALIAIRGDVEMGLWCVVWLLVVIWSTDTAAFFVGRTFGGPKIAPSISPKKTWSGGIGGALAAFASGFALAYFLDVPDAFMVGALSVGVSVVGQAGDFLESGFKRHFGVKDTSNLIPGHGGILDRLDSLITASVAAWFVGALHAGYDRAASGLLIWQ